MVEVITHFNIDTVREFREGSEFTAWGEGRALYFFASKIKPALSEAKQKIQPPAGGQKFYLPPSMIFQLEKLKCLKTPY